MIDADIFLPEPLSVNIVAEFGDVMQVTSSTARVRFGGSDKASKKYYACLKSYKPTVGDRVILLKLPNNYVILGAL